MDTPTRHRNVGSARSIVAVLFSIVLALTLIPATGAFSAPSDELVVNPGFTQGTTGWRTNNADQRLEVLDGQVAQLTTERGHAVLNDEINTVQGVTKKTAYTVVARVRTTTPDVTGAVRVREVSGTNVNVSQAYFNLQDSAWQTVSLQVTTVYPGSHLDLNVVAWDLPRDKNLQIDSVSMKEGAESVGSTPSTPQVPTKPTVPNQPKPCEMAPPSGTLYGANLDTQGRTIKQSLDGLDGMFGKVDVVRHFRPGLPLAWDNKSMELMRDRTLVTSFKVHPTEITSGKLDSFFKNWFSTAPDDQTIYWSYFHEPENNIIAGEFTEAQYRAAWKHLAELEQAACKPNLHATLILTEYTMRPASKRDYKVYDAGPQYVKVLAFDPYNGVKSLTRDFYESTEDLLGPLVSKMKADGRPWGIAELGSRQVSSDKDGAVRAEWLTSIAKYAEKNGALFVTYFQSVSTGGDFRLLDSHSKAAWRALVEK